MVRRVSGDASALGLLTGAPAIDDPAAAGDAHRGHHPHHGHHTRHSTHHGHHKRQSHHQSHHSHHGHHHHPRHGHHHHHHHHRHGHDKEQVSSHSRVMLQTTSKITSAVNSLYRTGPEEAAPVSITRPSMFEADAMAEHAHKKTSEQSSEESSASWSASSGSWSSSRSGSSVESSQQEQSPSDDEYDFKGAAKRVGDLLENLNIEARSDVMVELNDWYSSRKGRVEEDDSKLQQAHWDHSQREDEMKSSMITMLHALEDKQMNEVKVLVNFNSLLSKGAKNQLKSGRGSKQERRRFSRQEYDPRMRRRMAGLHILTPSQMPVQTVVQGGFQPFGADIPKKPPGSKVGKLLDMDENGEKRSEGEDVAELDGKDELADEEAACPASAKKKPEYSPAVKSAAIKVLDDEVFDVEGARRRLKELNTITHTAIGKARMVQDGGDKGNAGDVLGVLAQVQDGQVGLEFKMEIAEKAMATLRAALEHLAEDVEEPTEAVLALIQEVKSQVFGEDGDEFQRGPEPEELEAECTMLQVKLTKQELEVQSFGKRQARTRQVRREITASAGPTKGSASMSATEEDAPMMKKSVLFDGRLEKAILAASVPPPASASKLMSVASLQHTVFEEQVKLVSMNTSTSPTAGITSGGTGNTHPLAPVVDAPASKEMVALQEKVDIQTTKIKSTKQATSEMRYELSLLRYWKSVSDCNLDNLLRDIKAPPAQPASSPSPLDDVISGACVVGDTGAGEAGGLVAPGAAQPGPSKFSSRRQSAARHTTAEESPQRRLSSKDSARRGSLQGLSSQESAAEAEKQKKKQAADAERQKKLDELRGQAEAKFEKQAKAFEAQTTISKQRIKMEKEKRRQLKKEVKELHKDFKTSVKKSTLTKDELKALETMEKMNSATAKLNWHQSGVDKKVTALTDELEEETRMLENLEKEAKRKMVARRATLDMSAATSALEGVASRVSPVAESTSPLPEQTEETEAVISPPHLVDQQVKFSGFEPPVAQTARDRRSVLETGGGKRRSLLEARRSVHARGSVHAVSIGMDALASSHGAHSGRSEGTERAPSKDTVRQSMADGQEQRNAITELVAAQTKNVELKTEIDTLMEKIIAIKKAVKSSPGVGASGPSAEIKSLIGAHGGLEDPGKAPPEYYNLRREVRAQQLLVRQMRKNWWDEHRDIEVIVESARQNGTLGAGAQEIQEEQKPEDVPEVKLEITPVSRHENAPVSSGVGRENAPVSRRRQSRSATIGTYTSNTGEPDVSALSMEDRVDRRAGTLAEIANFTRRSSLAALHSAPGEQLQAFCRTLADIPATPPETPSPVGEGESLDLSQQDPPTKDLPLSPRRLKRTNTCPVGFTLLFAQDGEEEPAQSAPLATSQPKVFSAKDMFSSQPSPLPKEKSRDRFSSQPADDESSTVRCAIRQSIALGSAAGLATARRKSMSAVAFHPPEGNASNPSDQFDQVRASLAGSGFAGMSRRPSLFNMGRRPSVVKQDVIRSTRTMQDLFADEEEDKDKGEDKDEDEDED